MYLISNHFIADYIFGYHKIVSPPRPRQPLPRVTLDGATERIERKPRCGASSGGVRGPGWAEIQHMNDDARRALRHPCEPNEG
jgi:hypothetical protein